MSGIVKFWPFGKKKTLMGWKNCQIGFILCNLLFCVTVFSQQDAVSELRQQLLEARVALESFQERSRDLENQLAEKDAELEHLRSRYAELLVSTDQATDELARLEISAAHLIGQAENPGGKNDGAAVELLDALALVQRRLLELSDALQRHEKSITAVLDACQPSQPLRQTVEAGLGELTEKMSAVLQPVTLATTPHQVSDQLSAALLRLDSQTHIAVIDQGFLNGVRVGMTFALTREGATLVRLKVIESRALCSAVMLVQGDFRSLAPGMLLQREAALTEPPRELSH